MLPKLSEQPLYPQRGFAVVAFLLSVPAYLLVMRAGAYMLAPQMLIFVLWSVHAFWHEEQAPPPKLNHWIGAAVLLSFGMVLSITAGVLVFDWMPSQLTVSVAFQALIFAWIAGSLALPPPASPNPPRGVA